MMRTYVKQTLFCFCFCVGLVSVLAQTPDYTTMVSAAGVENFNITLTEDLQYNATTPYCQVEGLQLPDADNSETDFADVTISVEVGDVASVTFFGGSVTNDGEPVEQYSGPLTYYVTDSSDTGAAAGPLYVTKRPLEDSSYEFGFAEFVPQTVGESGYFSGSLSGACLYNITFTAVPSTTISG